MDSFGEMFENVLKYLYEQPNISDVGYKNWLAVLEPFKLENNTAYLLTKDEFYKKTTEEIYGKEIAQAFESVFGFPVDIKILVRTKESEANVTPVATDAPVGKAAPTPSINQDKLTFDNFIRGKSNDLAFACCTAVAKKADGEPDDKAQVFNPLFIYGDSGLGKTHLMKAIESYIKQHHPELSLIYTTTENFTNEFVQALSERSTTEFHNKYRSADYLLIDDIQFIINKDAVQEEFFHTFNDLYNAGKQIVLTSDIAPSKISRLENRMRSRFLLGMQVDIQPPDFETRMAIVKSKAELLDLQLSDNVARLIAEKIKTNIRQLEGTINKIKGLTTYTNEAPSIAMAQRVIKEIMIENHPAEITSERVIAEVANAFSVTSEDILSSNRRANISLARKVTIYLLKEIKGLTYIQIGNILNKNHSTMTIHYQDIVDKINSNADLKDTVNDIMKNLKEV
ncbi:chromosomal replication initiator protein [Ruminococcus sp. YE71]|uniref:chromosomal replication initiator protein DnaA n=1 Tax=unclassified Ruminococcus TaxID=2608920 RepID=UPI0008849295|nr:MULTISPECIES: chromosomal replication initiator protein DnaA [unclassified Ruminococcus]SDA31566.1 chromosomal replication initiator protein [Ruminococcus sp. YE78]SFW52252.1 chromosomal replication initiator protein [Ruminococcus sp. YE71]